MLPVHMYRWCVHRSILVEIILNYSHSDFVLSPRIYNQTTFERCLLTVENYNFITIFCILKRKLIIYPCYKKKSGFMNFCYQNVRGTDLKLLFYQSEQDSVFNLCILVQYTIFCWFYLEWRRKYVHCTLILNVGTLILFFFLFRGTYIRW